MSEVIAYALREAYAGTVTQREHDEDPGTEVPAFSGGVIAAGDVDIDVREALDEDPHPGYIVVAETNLAAVQALDEYPPLKRVPSADLEVSVDELDAPADDLDGASVASLRTIAKREGLEGYSGLRAPVLRSAIRRHREIQRDASRGEAPDSELRELGAPAGELAGDDTASTENDR